MAKKKSLWIYQFGAYLVVYGFAFLFIIGLATAFFEDATEIRILGGIISMLSIIAGNVVAKRAWPRKPMLEK